MRNQITVELAETCESMKDAEVPEPLPGGRWHGGAAGLPSPGLCTRVRAAVLYTAQMTR